MWRALGGLPAGLQVTSLAFAGSVSLGNVLPTADIAQFKQGVKSVAGKMAVLANGVMNSLQVSTDSRWNAVSFFLALSWGSVPWDAVVL